MKLFFKTKFDTFLFKKNTCCFIGDFFFNICHREFEDNYIEKDVILDSQDKVNKEPLSRRKKQKKDFASFEKNQRKKIKSGTSKIEKKIKTKKKKPINKASKKKED